VAEGGKLPGYPYERRSVSVKSDCRVNIGNLHEE
jgi:hypothetical protein